jgi:hypothetical protein
MVFLQKRVEFLRKYHLLLHYELCIVKSPVDFLECNLLVEIGNESERVLKRVCELESRVK